MKMDRWTEFNSQLMRTYKFTCFTDAMSWMIKASYKLKELDYFPVWTNIGSCIYVSLFTPTIKGREVTNRDRDLANILDELYRMSYQRNPKPVSRVMNYLQIDKNRKGFESS